MSDGGPRISSQFLDELRLKVSLPTLISGHVKLQKAGKASKGCCPFHKESTPSFVVYDDGYKCFGCQASGDHIRWLTDYCGQSFLQAVATLAERAGLPLPDGVHIAPGARDRAPVQRERAVPERDVAHVDSLTFARLVWKRAQGQHRWPVQTYLEKRGVPRGVLERRGVMDDLLFCPRAPFAAWPLDRDVARVKCGPAMAAVIRAPFASDADAEEGYPAGIDRACWPIIGVHVTWLSPDFTDNLRDSAGRSRRKMLGNVQGGCVLLGDFGWQAPLAVGEGIETVLSALADLDGYCGLAALSLDNLQGQAVRDDRGALPMWNLQPDMGRAALRFRHDAPVRILADADMKPLRVQMNARCETVAPKIAEAAKKPWVIREIGQAERAWMCGQLATKGWRAAGSADVSAFRPRMGMDFNDQRKDVA